MEEWAARNGTQPTPPDPAPRRLKIQPHADEAGDTTDHTESAKAEDDETLLADPHEYEEDSNTVVEHEDEAREDEEYEDEEYEDEDGEDDEDDEDDEYEDEWEEVDDDEDLDGEEEEVDDDEEEWEEEDWDDDEEWED